MLLRHRRIALLLPLLLSLAACAGGGAHTGDDPAEVAKATLTKVGDLAPEFTVPLLGGGRFDLAEQRGKVVLVNFFATWCPPCREEMPHLQDEVWERFAGGDFAMISVDREEEADKVAPFVKDHGAGWLFGLDEHREVFARYATGYIPRTYVIDRDGRIVFQGQGYGKDEFARMVRVIEQQLAKPAS